jgi:hypothetical protein
MLDQYVDSITPAFSDDEDFQPKSLVSKVRCFQSLPSVESVIVAAKPASVAIMHFVDLSNRYPLYSEDSQVGFAAVINATGFICVNKDIIFDITTIFEDFKKIIFLQARQGSSEGVRVLSNFADEKIGKFGAIVNPVVGMGASFLTLARIHDFKCILALCEHKSIRVDLDCILSLFEAASHFSDLPQTQREAVIAEFRKHIPINSKVPLYT